MKWHPNIANTNNEENPVKFYRKNKNGQFLLFKVRTFPWRTIGICLVLSLAIFLLFTLNGRAQEAMKGLICDTQEAATQIIKAQDKMAEMALVNTERAICGIVVHSSIKIRVVDSFTTQEGPTEIWEIVTLGLSPDGQTMVSLGAGVTQYAPFFAEVSPAVHKSVGVQA